MGKLQSPINSNKQQEYRNRRISIVPAPFYSHMMVTYCFKAASVALALPKSFNQPSRKPCASA